MARALKLSDREHDRLDTLRITTDHPDVFRNATIILMTADGHSKFTIAHTLGCCPSTVDRVRGLYREKGLLGLRPIKPPGRPPKTTAAYRRALRKTVESDPRSFGYAFAVWTAPRLNAHLKKVTGVSFSDGHLRDLLHQEGFSLHRPKHTLKGKRDEKAHTKAKKQLQCLKKKRADRTPTKSWSFRTKSRFICTPL